ncbi:MAG TPA: LysR family transcriptional regulator [Polyangiaceae bacterium]|nr:LysR family transcriptional regulator [Polyangiaceae bacterium]
MNTLPDLDGVNLNHLLYFHVVASCGSIAAAARALRMAPSTIGEQLRELEASLGEPLFARAGRELKLNDAGRLVQEQTAIMLTAAERIVGQFHPEQAKVISLRVGYSSSLSRTQAAHDVLPLLELKQARVRIECIDSTQITQALLRGELDLALTDQPPPEPLRGSISFEPLAGSPLVVVIGSAQTNGGRHTEELLSKLPLFQYTVTSRLRWEVEQWLRARGLRPNILAESDDCGVMLAAARAGRCFCVVPQAALLDIQVGLQIVEQASEDALPRYALYQGGSTVDLVKAALALMIGQKESEAEARVSAPSGR